MRGKMLKKNIFGHFSSRKPSKTIFGKFLLDNNMSYLRKKVMKKCL